MHWSRSTRRNAKYVLVLFGVFGFISFGGDYYPFRAKPDPFEGRFDKVENNESCYCDTGDGGRVDFCYTLPLNKSVVGRRFGCQHYDTVKRLGLLDASSFIDLSTTEMPDPVFVTAFSTNHQIEAKRLLHSIRTNFRHQLLIVYDLGLDDDTKNFFIDQCRVQVRKFDFNQYPPYVQNLQEFRWKPLIIAEVLREYGAVWYMDTSVFFKKNDLSHVYDLVRCRRNQGDLIPLPSITDRDVRERLIPHEHDWDKAQWNASLKECRKSAYLFHGYTGHGTFPATHPDLYQFLPTNIEEMKKPKAKMYEAGFIFAVRTVDTIEGVLKWYVLCALEHKCMAPLGSSLGCAFRADRFAEYAGCHRFDQSVANLLAANAFWYDRHYYVSEIVDFFNVIRSNILPNTPDFRCDV